MLTRVVANASLPHGIPSFSHHLPDSFSEDLYIATSFSSFHQDSPLFLDGTTWMVIGTRQYETGRGNLQVLQLSDLTRRIDVAKLCHLQTDVDRWYTGFEDTMIVTTEDDSIYRVALYDATCAKVFQPPEGTLITSIHVASQAHRLVVTTVTEEGSAQRAETAIYSVDTQLQTVRRLARNLWSVVLTSSGEYLIGEQMYVPGTLVRIHVPSGAITVFPVASEQLHFRITPDDTYVLYLIQEQNHLIRFTIADGSTIMLNSWFLGFVRGFGVTPDKNYVLVEAGLGSERVYLVRIDGTRQLSLHPPEREGLPGGVIQPKFTSDGKLVFYFLWSSSLERYYLYKAKISKEGQVHVQEIANYPYTRAIGLPVFAELSTNGQYVIYQVDRDSQLRDLYIAPLEFVLYVPFIPA